MVSSARFKVFILAAAGCLFALTAGAQSSTTSSTAATGSTTSTTQNAPRPGTYGKRAENQQDRIAQGMQSGQLTAGETQHLEKEDSAINREAQMMRSQDNGHLTAADRKALNQQQNNMSKQIYQDKHNANAARYGNNEVGQRRENQQDRIAQGVRSGQLTAGETAKLEKQQQNINHQVAADRAANGGKLTPAEKQQINKEQNQASKNIYKKKHNSATQKH